MTTNTTSETDSSTTNSANESDTDVTKRIITNNVEPTVPREREYSIERDAETGMYAGCISQLLDDHPFLMHVLQAAVEEDAAFDSSTIHKYLDADAVSRDDLKKPFWLLERIDVLATDDHSTYLTRTSSDIYMAFYSLATEPHTHSSDSHAIDLRDFTVARTLLLDILTRHHYARLTIPQLADNTDMPKPLLYNSLKWLLDNNLISAHADESYTVNMDSLNAKAIRDIQTALVTYGGAFRQHDVSVAMDYHTEHR